MKLVNLALASALLVGITTVGCTHKTDDNNNDDSTTLSTSEAEMVDDDSDASDTDDDVEVGVDDTLSGSTPTDPGTPADGATDDEVLEKMRTNPGLFFKPAGCITSTRQGNVIRHVFNACTGPYGMVDFNGTITTTIVREPGKLTITYAADGFKINGATVTGSRIVVFTKEGTLITKTRTGNWSGTTGKGKPITHNANFVTTYDTAAKCITRDGSAQTTVGGRTHERVIDGYKRCGIGRLGCPESGTVTLSRTVNGNTLTLKIEFLGGVRYRVTRPNGKQVVRLLLCRPNAG